MRRFLFFLFWVAISGLIGVYLVHNHGSLIITFNNTMISMPIWLGVLALIVALIALKVIIQIVAKIFGIPFQIGRGLSRRKQRKAIELLREMLTSVIIEDWLEVEKQTNKPKNNGKALQLSEEVSYFEIKSQIEQGNFLAAQKELKLLSEENKETVMYYWLLASCFIGQGDFDQANKTLEVANEKHSSEFVLTKLYFRVLMSSKRYAKAASLLDKIKRMRDLDKVAFKSDQVQAYSGSLVEASKISPMAISESWDRIPSALKNNREVVVAYIDALFKQQQKDKAFSITEKYIKKDPGKEYLPLLESHDFGGKEISFLNKILNIKLINVSADDYLNIAKVYLKVKEYKHAIEYIKRSLEINETLNAYVLLAETYNRQNLLAQEAECYQKLHKMI
jgi:heme biosynthesis-associated TPR repeat protein